MENALLHPTFSEVCKFCHKSGTEKMLNCSACKRAKYCNKQCQKADWSAHKDFCKLVVIHKEKVKAQSISISEASEGPAALPSMKEIDELAELFIKVHREPIVAAATNALVPFGDPTKWQNHMLLISVRPRITGKKDCQRILKKKDLAAAGAAFEIVTTRVFPIPETTYLPDVLEKGVLMSPTQSFAQEAFRENLRILHQDINDHKQAGRGLLVLNYKVLGYSLLKLQMVTLGGQQMKNLREWRSGEAKEDLIEMLKEAINGC